MQERVSLFDVFQGSELLSVIRGIMAKNDENITELLIKIYIESIERREWEAVKLLCTDERVDPNSNDGIIISLLYYGEVEMIKILSMNKRINKCFLGNAIGWASDKGNYDLVKFLLENTKAEPINKYWSPSTIGIASQKGHIEIVKLLLADSRVDPSFNNNEAIKLAFKNDHMDIVKLLFPLINKSSLTEEEIFIFDKKINPVKKIIKSSIPNEEKMKELVKFIPDSMKIEKDNNGERVCLIFNY